jgi:serine/threonine protein kinase/AraC-like DNA-binding protein/tetratricopeptide (TPR) repeat protein
MNLEGVYLNGRFKLTSLFAEGGMSYLYRAEDTATGIPVVAKILKPGAVSNRIEDIIRYRSVIEKLEGIKNPHIAGIIASGNLEQSFGQPLHFIIIEMVEGNSLQELLTAGRIFSPDEAAQITLQACRGLDAVHRLGIIHGDIKPGNILMTGAGGVDVRLTDFGLSRVKMAGDMNYNRDAAGTFCFMAPEQVGLIHRAIDERSDLYSLGAVLYELLTGTLPFSGESLVALLHEQAARLPDPPSKRRPEVPAVLDRIALKLLAKEPEDRYQGAAGLERDLERFLDGETDFAPGRDDRASRIDFTISMVGRSSELAQLKSLLANARAGAGRLCLITGEAGIGKTRLADEFRKEVIASGIPHIEGRAFNRENRTPHGPLYDALSDYIRQYSHYQEDRRRAVAGLVHKQCGDQGRIITNFHRHTAVLLGICPEIVPLQPEQEIQRFYATLCRFIESLAAAENGLVISLDDLHWSDRGTLVMLKELKRSISGVPLLVLCGFRHNEIDEDHPLNVMARGNGPVEEIRILHLNRDTVVSLVKSIVRMSDRDHAMLADFIARKGGGNPLFSIEIIKHLMHEKLIAPDGTGWTITSSRLDETDIPETITSTLLKRTESLGNEVIELLSRAAVIGKTFELELLMKLEPWAGAHEASRDARIRAVIDNIDRAEEQHLVSRKANEAGKISFTHDRVRDAFYGRISPQERKRLHRLIGIAMEQERREGSGNIVFDLAYHWIQAGDEEKILEHARHAETKARENYSYKDAIGYLKIILSILESRLSLRPNAEDSRNMLQCILSLAETHLDIFEPNEAIKLLNRALPLIDAKEERGALYLLLTKAYFLIGDHETCEKMAARGLGLLGEKIPRSRAETIIGSIKALATHLFYSAFYKITKARALPREPEATATILRYFDWLWFRYAFVGAPKLAWITLRRLALVEKRIGPSRELILCRMNYALMLALVLPRWQERILRSLPDETAEVLGERPIFSYYYTKGFIHYVNCDFPEAISVMKKGFELSEKTGETFGLYWAGFFAFAAHHLRSEYDDAWKAFNKALQYVKSDIEDLTIGSWCFPAEFYIETGQFNKARELFDRNLEKLRHMKMWSQFSYMSITFAYLLLETDEPEQALARLEETLNLIHRRNLPIYWLSTVYPRYAQALIAVYLKKRSSLLPKQRRSCMHAIYKACRVAIRKTERDRFISMVSFRMLSHYYALNKDLSRAKQCFEKSIDIAVKVGRRYEEARSRYEYGIFLKNAGDRHAVWEQMVTASMIFDEIGVTVFRERIASQLGLALDTGPGTESRISREKTLHMIEQSRSFAACPDQASLLDRVLSLSMEVAGARNGWLFLHDDATGNLEPAAERSVDPAAMQDYSRSIVQEVFDTGRLMVAADAAADEDLSARRSVAHHNLKSILCAPLEFGGVASGVCYLDNPLVGGLFGDEEARIVSLLLSSASIAVENLLMREKSGRDSTPAASAHVRPDGNLQRVIDYLEGHFKEDVTRNDLANIIGVHPDYLGKLFKARMGKTIREYANSIRIRWAMDRLSETNDKIIAVAYDAGFESLRTFNRIFLRISGMTPLEYRERNKENMEP